MSFLMDDMRNWLMQQGVTKPIFIGQEPDQPDACVTIYPTGGFPTNAHFEDISPTMQIRVRASVTGWEDGWATVNQVFNLLDNPSDRVVQISSGRNVAIQAMQPPQGIGRDADDRPIFVFNVRMFTTRDS